jgi:hypothetical protein
MNTHIICETVTRQISAQESSGEWLYYGPGDEAECEAAKARLEAVPLTEGEKRIVTVLSLKPLEEA